MIELSNFELCILLDLCYKHDYISVVSAPEKSTELYCSKVTSLYQKIITIEKNMLLLNKDKSGLNGIYRNIEGAYRLRLKITNKVALDDFLRKYIEYHSNDKLHPYEEYTFLTKIKEFVKSVDSDRNLTHYYINDNNTIPVLLYGLNKEEILLKELKYELFPPKEMISRTSMIKLKHQNYKGNVENDFGFEAIVDISKFYDNYKNSLLGQSIVAKNETTNDSNRKLKALNRLNEVEIHIISVKHHLEQIMGEKATYQRIAEYMSNNKILKISENNIKQKVNMSIYTNLDVYDLSQAVQILKENNMLKTYPVD
ncbi:MAG: hypothetical protein NC200_00940 [Candidatus Gastranaerophilales bacterium]|nr:hypothetical protein [Candidatus Gastranaerophilales bacterium]